MPLRSRHTYRGLDQSTVCAEEIPLYRVKDFYLEQDVEVLFGKCVKANHFNEHALVKTTDKIYAAGPQKGSSTVVLKAREINCRVLHGDASARLMYGAYEEEEGLNVTRGYNWEHRKHLTQFKIGLVVTDEGFPVIGEVLDGNVDDKTWNKQLRKNLPEHFNLEELSRALKMIDFEMDIFLKRRSP
ncbi:MAG: DUF4277 domain-containing protein [Bacillota bacterium]